jgi:4'-phosphopantetheinyl transferase
LLPYAKAPPPSHQLELRDGVLHLWLIDVTSPGDDQLAALKQWLMPEEIERNECYAQSVSRRRDVVCRATLRQLLCRYLGLGNAELRLDRTENGKPLLTNISSSLQFNYSHSGDFAAFALVQGPQVGIDIEHSLRKKDLLAISNRFFSETEVADLAALPEAVRRDRFFAYWTLKEAYIKARGEGIFIGLQNFSFHLAEDNEQAIGISFGPADFDEINGWQFFRLLERQEYPVAVALKDKHRNYVLHLEDTAQLYF